MRIELLISRSGTEPYQGTFTGQEIEIGRNPACQLSLSNESNDLVAWNHAKILQRGRDAFITDLRSPNGTYVNGKRIVAIKRLLSGDEIRLGENGLRLRVVALDFAVASASSSAGDAQSSVSSTGAAPDDSLPRTPASLETSEPSARVSSRSSTRTSSQGGKKKSETLPKPFARGKSKAMFFAVTTAMIGGAVILGAIGPRLVSSVLTNHSLVSSTSNSKEPVSSSPPVTTSNVSSGTATSSSPANKSAPDPDDRNPARLPTETTSDATKTSQLPESSKNEPKLDTPKPESPSDSVFLVIVEEPKSGTIWGIANATAVSDRHLLTNGIIGVELAKQKSKGRNIYVLRRSLNERTPIHSVLVQLGAQNEQPDQQIFCDYALLVTSTPHGARPATMAGPSDIAALEQGTPVTMVAIAFGEDPVDRFQRLEPQFITAKIFGITRLAQAAGAPLLSHVRGKFTERPVGCPVLNQQGHMVGVYADAEMSGDGTSPLQLHYVPILNSEIVELGLNDAQASQVWITPVISAPPNLNPPPNATKQ